MVGSGGAGDSANYDGVVSGKGFATGKGLAAHRCAAWACVHFDEEPNVAIGAALLRARSGSAERDRRLFLFLCPVLFGEAGVGYLP